AHRDLHSFPTRRSSDLAQVTGGQRAFEYLRMSNSPHVSALGGMVVSFQEKDVSIALQNPALLQPYMHNQLALNYNVFYAGIGIRSEEHTSELHHVKISY